MFRSLSAAEKAALEGEGQEMDTQQCVNLQEDILSVSRSAAASIGGGVVVVGSHWSAATARVALTISDRAVQQIREIKSRPTSLQLRLRSRQQ